MQSPASSADGGVVAEPLPQGEDAASELMLEHLPAPAKEYKRFTARNLELARLVSSELADQPDPELKLQNELLQKQGIDDVVDFDLRELVNPPSLKGVKDRGGWEVFGVRNPIVELSSSLAEMGIEQLYEAGADRRELLKKLLHTVLFHYVQLLDELVKPPPGGGPRTAAPDAEVVEPPYKADILIDQIRLACLNMHMLVNELRPMQARETLKAMLRLQIDRRKARTEVLRKTCAHASAAIADLKSRYTATAMDAESSTAASAMNNSQATSNSHIGSLGEEAAWQRVVAAVGAL